MEKTMIDTEIERTEVYQLEVLFFEPFIFSGGRDHFGRT
jgi:hypothetical protein